MASTLRTLEKTAKGALWHALGLLFSRRHKQRTPLDLSQIKSVLVVRPDRLGDVVLSTPVYESLKASIPGATVTALVDRPNAGVLADNPFVDHILPFDRKRPWRALRRLRQEKYDLAFTLNKTFSATASLLTFFSGARIKVGYRHPENAWMHDVTLPPDTLPRHEIENNLELLRILGLPNISTAPALYFNEQENQKVQNLLREERKHPDRPLVLIKPGTRVAEWGWQIRKFQKVTETLLRSEAAEVFIISGPGEENLIYDFMEGLKHKPFRLPQLPVRELACLMQYSDLLFCNHTGIMHLASAVQTPVLAIFKHGDIKRWGPYNNKNIVLEERTADSLPPEAVLKSIEQLLNREKSAISEPQNI